MEREKQRLLSVVVPVYNAEKFIRMCLDSLVHQNLDSDQYEVICVNDGSTDSSLAILREYEQNYSNLRVIDKPNGGVSVARNLGLELAEGEYVWFVDADDWVARNCFGMIAQQLCTHQPSVLQMYYNYIKAQWRVDECAEKLLNLDEAVASEHGPVPMKYDGAWSSVVKKSLLCRYEHKFVVNLHYGEDLMFIRDLFDKMRLEQETGTEKHKVVHCEGDIFYYYRMHDESAMQKSWGPNRGKYMDAMVEWGRINRARMLDETKPQWYREKYEDLFFTQMHNYMMNWLPGGTENLSEHLKYLKAEKLYPCPRVPRQIRKKWLDAAGLKGKVVAAYRYAAFRCKWIYRIYYKQMAKKYAAAQTQK